MALFIPNIITVEPVHQIAQEQARVNMLNKAVVPQGTEFQKIYFEELTKKRYMEDGNLEGLSEIARIHQEEYYGFGGTHVKRFKIVFTEFNITINMEENFGRLVVKAA